MKLRKPETFGFDLKRLIQQMTEISAKVIPLKHLAFFAGAVPVHSFLVPIKRSFLLAAIWPVSKLNAGAFVFFRGCFSF